MSRRRSLGRVAALVLLVCGPALPASADGLSRFQEAMKQAPSGSLTYKNAEGLGENGFVLDDVVLTPPPDKTQGAKAEPIAIKRVSVEDFDFVSVDKNLPPHFIKLRAEGIAIGNKPLEGVDLAQMAGLDKVTADFQLDYRFEPERKTLSLDRLELDLSGLARMEVSFVLDGITADDIARPDAAMDNATLRTATIAYEDRSLLAKVLPAAAKLQSTDADALVKTGSELLGGLRAGQGPEALAVLDAVFSYIGDYKAPKGPLRVTVNPPAKTSAATIAATKTPDEAIKALGLVVSYAGTKPGPAPSAVAPASVPATGSAASGGKGGCTLGTRYFVMHEDAWWAVTVRGTGKGDQCVARIDGGGADDDLTFALDKTLAWDIDGPGRPVAKCRGGDKVLVESDGGWYAAKVSNKPFADGQCPVKFEAGDEEEETVELKRVRRLD
jgi:hypothetical protein